jgi:hypothetical protein
MMSVHTENVIEISKMLGKPTILAFYHECKNDSGAKKLREASVLNVRQLVEDRLMGKQTGMTPQQRARVLELNALGVTARNLRRAHEFLATNDLYKKKTNISTPTKAGLDVLIERITHDPSCLRTQRFIARIVGNLADRLAEQSPDPYGSNFTKMHGSTFSDLGHCVGAVYSDAFTCDKRTDLDLGDLRTQHGRQRQLSYQAKKSQSPAAFVTEIETQLDRASS